MVAISITKEDLATLSVKVHLTGLTPGIRYDVMRLQLRSLGKNDAGVRVYEREVPDRRGLWSSVGHRIGWQAPATTANFRDYECPKRPTQYFVCTTAAEGPHEYDFGSDPPPTKYPVSRGALSTEVVHFNGEIADLNEEPDEGHVVVRSVHELAHYADACVVEMEGPTYTARAYEHAVMGAQYPVVVSDSREARRGSVTLMTRNLGEYNALRRIVFPESGRIRPFVMNAGGDRSLLLDDMRCLPLDVEVEQSSQQNPDYRFVTIDYVEVDGTAPLIARTGDNDDLTTAPEANFTFSDTTPAVGQWIQLTNTSTGAGDDWEWTVEATMDNLVGKFYTNGPHMVRFRRRGTVHVKLRFGGSGAGWHTRVKTVDVH